ncbi:MAG TPA: phosphate ABC transporter substrate-binding protein PstS [Dehalococcoidales bacterium]|nr:phosphate ABC transporter substrate-binding protein PstS [Dehalococcoidales bacterium]
MIKSRIKWFLPLALIILTAVILTGCSATTTVTSTSTSTTTQATTTTQVSTTTQTSTTTQISTTTIPVVQQAKSLNGAGATFPQPLYTKWFDQYNKQFGVQINYQGVGSGAGINQITAGTVDFGASDGIMTADQQTKAEAAGGPILHIPMTSGAVAVIYNLSGISSGTIKLTGDVLAKIYLKTITKWNDPQITALNPGVNLPNTAIGVVHRSDGSGTTYIFTNYLSKVSSDWSTKVGNATSVNWPGDIGAEKNAGVAGAVQQTPGSIGYVELAYAIQNNLPWVLLQNAAGNYEAPSIDGVTKATIGVTLPDDMKIMITNSTNPDAYPICGYTWILVFQNQTDQAKGLALVNMLWWAIHDGQQYGAALDYAALSSAAVAKAEAEILSIKYNSQPLLKK